jgi:hypothetical protein
MSEPLPEEPPVDVEPEPIPDPNIPVYTAPVIDPPPNPDAYPQRGEQGGDGG